MNLNEIENRADNVFNGLIAKGFLENSNIPKEYLSYKWNNYRSNYNAEAESGVVTEEDVIQSRVEAFREAYEYAKNIRENSISGKSLVFIGGKGTGKTVLATLILREAIQQLREESFYISFSSLCVGARSTHNSGVPPDEFIYQYVEPKFLCIDEVYQKHLSDLTKDCVEQIISERRQRHRPTIITSKIGIHEIGQTCGAPVEDIIDDPRIYKKIRIKQSGEAPLSQYMTERFDKATFNAHSLIEQIKSKNMNRIGGRRLREFLEKSLIVEDVRDTNNF